MNFRFFRNTISQTKLYLLNEQPTGSKTNLNSNTKDQKEDAKDVLKRNEEIKIKMKMEKEREREIALEMEREKERIENEKNAKKEELTMNEEFQEEPQYKWKVSVES